LAMAWNFTDLTHLSPKATSVAGDLYVAIICLHGETSRAMNRVRVFKGFLCGFPYTPNTGTLT
jgi:hypothetical protein